MFSKLQLGSAISLLVLGVTFSILLPIFEPTFALGASQAPEVSSRPILFVHGFNPFGLGEDCQHDWAPMEATLTSQGFTGQKITVGYYGNDKNCDVLSSPHGTILSHISDISKDLAWYVFDQFSSHGVSVDFVTHSMGGLMVRYALYRSAVGDPDFPPYLLISHAATMAAPFTGYSLLAETCHINIVNIQCDEMFPYSSFIKELKKPEALVPQGPGGTLWSGIGSNADFIERSDGFVNSSSATSMKIPKSAKTILPWHMFVFHTGYTHNKKVIAKIAFNLGGVEAVVPTPASDDLPGNIDAVLPRGEFVQDFSQLPSEQQPANVEPYLENDQPRGVLFTNVLVDGLFAKMGIQSGDVVRGCTEENINAPFEKLDNLEASTVPIVMSFCVFRNGTIFPRKIRVIDKSGKTEQ